MDKNKILENLRVITPEFIRLLFTEGESINLLDKLTFDGIKDNYLYEELYRNDEKEDFIELHNQAIDELKELGVTDIIVSKEDNEEYDTKPNKVIIELKGVNLFAGYRYVYYSYGETDADEEVCFYEPYKVEITKYKIIK